MALPLLWLGAAVIGSLAAKELAEQQYDNDLKRKLPHEPESLDALAKYDSVVGKYPSEMFNQDIVVKPEIGAIVCCTIAGVLDHTGIWIGDNTIVELHGDGLIKAVSSERFLDNRSGSKIFIACDSAARPIIDELAAQRAISMIYQYREYDLITNNCNRFVWHCVSGTDEKLTTFKELNQQLAKWVNKKVYWDLCQLN